MDLLCSDRPLVTSPATVRIFVFCNLQYSTPIMFLPDSVTLISTLMMMITTTIIIIIIILSTVQVRK